MALMDTNTPTCLEKKTPNFRGLSPDRTAIAPVYHTSPISVKSQNRCRVSPVSTARVFVQPETQHMPWQRQVRERPPRLQLTHITARILSRYSTTSLLEARRILRPRCPSELLSKVLLPCGIHVSGLSSMEKAVIWYTV